MAYDFDGVDDDITFGTDASIGGFTTMTFIAWCARDASGDINFVGGKDRYGVVLGLGWQSTTDNLLTFEHGWSGDNGSWRTTGALTGLNQVGATYDGGATTNDPVIYANGASVAFTELVAPTLVFDDDSAQNLRIGETGAAGQQFDGVIGHVCWDNTIWTAADVNRHRWWGVGVGGLQCMNIIDFMCISAGQEG